ncbi:MAG: hypothetical protein EXQ89_02505 [Rhodospirillaceae bacterium]|nr:hypothetical protein [Rhodospirillaceae bacterium]
MILELFDLLRPVIWPAISITLGFGGVWLGGRLADRREVVKRRYEFIARQLSEFYAPLLGIRMEIRARSEVRLRIDKTAKAAWQELCEQSREIGIEALQKLTKERAPEFSAITDYENKQLREALLPAYRKMVEIFRDKSWLAEADTRDFFPTLVEFIEIWDRHIGESLPFEVNMALGHSEEKLHPLYDNLQTTHDRLRSILAAGNVGS